MASKKRVYDNIENLDESNKKQRKVVMNPGLAGLPAKPIFSQPDVRSCSNISIANNITNNNDSDNNIINNASLEVFPGMIVNLPNEKSAQNTTFNDNNVQNNQPSVETLNLFSSILETMKQQQENANNHLNYQSYQKKYSPQDSNLQFQSQYGYQQSQNNDVNNTVPFTQYTNSYNFDQNNRHNQNNFQNYNLNYNNNLNNNSNNDNNYANTQQFSNNLNNQQNSAFFSVFNQFLQSYNNSQQTQESHPQNSISDINTINSKKPTKQKKNNKNNKSHKEINSGKDLKKDIPSDDDDILLDDEAEFGKKVAIQGTNIVFENDEDIKKWIEERKKNWPTNKRVEEKKKDIEKAKKIIENLNCKNSNNDSFINNDNNETYNEISKPKIKMCNFWLKHKKCKNGKNCKFSHDMSNYVKPNKNTRNKSKVNNISTRPLKNHKLKLIHGIPVQIPSRFTPLNNEGKSLHNLIIEGEQFQKENVQLLDIFSKMVKYGVIKNDWDTLKKKLKLDDNSLNLN